MSDQFRSDWWADEIKAQRSKVAAPAKYVADYLARMSISDRQIRDNVEFLLIDVRELIYDNYLLDEARLNTKLMRTLFQSEIPFVRQQLQMTLANLPADLSGFSRGKVESLIVEGVAQASGACFAYIQALSTSNTNARRSRAGTTFETLFARALSAFSIPFEDQNSLGSQFYSKNNLGKKVDFIVPSAKQYEDLRNKCSIISTKTTLRERWQQVVEELERSNVPHIYLATLGEDVTQNGLTIMKNYNITLVVPSVVKSRYQGFHNVVEFQQFFEELSTTYSAKGTARASLQLPE
jgi:hypothetical protein